MANDRGLPEQAEREDRVDVVAGAPDRGHRRRWAAWVALASLLLVAGAGWSADQRARAHEAAAIARCEHGLRVASALSEDRLGLLTTYVQPALRTHEGVQELHLADLMAASAGRVLTGAQRADRTCRAVSVRPWHFSLVARRDAALAYSGALVTLLQTLAAQGPTHFHDDAVLVRLAVGAGAG